MKSIFVWLLRPIALLVTAVVLFVSSLTGTVFAGQFAALSRSVAEKAAALLKTHHEEVRKLCEPAGHYWPTDVMIFDGEVGAYESDGYWYIRVGDEYGEELDLAYTYIKEGSRWVNVALRLGLKAEGVTKSFDEPKLWISEPASGYVKLTVTKGGENIRGLPGQHSPVVSRADSGEILIAEAKTIKNEDDGSEWYRVVAFPDGQNTLKLAANSPETAFIHPVIPVNHVTAEPLDEDLAARMEWYHSKQGTPPESDGRFTAGSAHDWSEEAQREVAQKGLPMTGVAPVNKITINDPSATQGESLTFLTDRGNMQVFTITSKTVDETEWYLLTDHFLKQAGWVKAGDFRVITPDRGGDERFYYHFTNLCRNLDTTLSTFGPLTGRQQDVQFGDDGAEAVMYFITQNFEGANFTFNVFHGEDGSTYPMGGTIWGKGKGLGGIFIGVDWCGKEYVRHLLGEPSEININEEGDEEWDYSVESHDLWVTFDGHGLVKQLFVHMGGG